MASYEQAFKEGIKAAEDTHFALKEIHEVISECSQNISHVSDGKIAEVKIILRNRLTGRILASAAPWEKQSVHSQLYLSAIGRACDAADPQAVDLAEIEIGSRGYPVNLSYRDLIFACHDKESLEDGLARLLAHPATGEKLLRLMQRESSLSS